MRKIFKKKLNSKGFSLIELMAALVILAIITVVTVVAVARFIDKSKQQKIVQNKKNVAVAAELYLQANRDLVPKVIGDSTKIMLSELRKSNYIKEDVKNAKDEDCMKESYVYVVKLSENDYSYTTKLYCGDEHPDPKKPVPMPYLLTLTNPQGGTGKIIFSNKDDVKKANFSFTIKGGTEDDGKEIGIYSYSYTILAKTGYDDDYTELYNSGVIDAKKAPTVEFKSRALGTYVDLAGVTKVKIRVTALNEEGGYLTYDQTNGSETSGSGKYEDKVAPICPSLDDYAARNHEPHSLDDWVSKKDIGSPNYPRIISLKCEDGDGSGCKRDTFSEAWPNINDKKYEFGVMFGNIRLEDNAVIDENGEKEAPNVATCPINVFVDLQSPTVTIDIINPSPAEGKDSHVAQDVEYNGKKIQKGGKVVVKDLSSPINNESVPTMLTINSINYANNYHLYKANEGWLNAKQYPEGVEYEVLAQDNIYLYEIDWQVNCPFDGINTANLNVVHPQGYKCVYPDGSEYEIESYHWKRTEDPNDEMYIDEVELYNNKQELTAEQNNKAFTVKFYNEGARHGTLKVKDRAGNTTTIEIYANLDRTTPPIDNAKHAALKIHVPGFEDDDELQNSLRSKNDYEDTSEELGWADPYEVELIERKNGIIPSFVDPTRIPAYKNRGNWPIEWGGGGGYSYHTDYEEPVDKERAYCAGNEDTGIHGIIRGDSYSVVERKETGCYKVGVRDGDNQIKTQLAKANNGNSQRDYEDTESFIQISNALQYSSGKWSNEEVVCGPKEDEMYDNEVTVIKDGQKIQITNPNVTGDNKGKEIAGWGGMSIDYFRQLGVKYSDSDDELEPVYGMTPTESYIISIRDRHEWPVFRDQGTHRLYWSNCDAAGNCTDWEVQENLRIDTIAPQCKNKVTYDENLNSDGGTGPNKYGWLYDQQVATVSHDCADTSYLYIKDFDTAYLSVNSIREEGFNIRQYHEYGSGCNQDNKTTDEVREYSEDVYTCTAGTRGIGDGHMGEVGDIAGNTRECTTGAIVRKDSAPPVCKSEAVYKGENSQGEMDRPNTHGWAWGLQEIYTKKGCRDDWLAKSCSEIPGCPNYMKNNPYIAMSGCTAKDDFENYERQIRIPETFYEKNDLSDLPSENVVLAGKPDHKGETRNYDRYKPENKSTFKLDDHDIDAEIGTSNPTWDAETGKIVFKDGYVIDRAGNISEDKCEPVWVRRDSYKPSCSNEVRSPNIMYMAYDTEGNDTPWEDDVDTNTGRLRDKPYKLWFGRNGLDGTHEYAEVYKGCQDNKIKNYPGILDPEYVMSECKYYKNPMTEVYYYGQKAGYTGSNIARVADGTGHEFTYATYKGDQPTSTPIKCSSEVEDDAGNRGTGYAAPIQVNIDYKAPTCGTVNIVQASNGYTYFEPNRLQRYSTKKMRDPYNQKLTHLALGVYVDCRKDDHSGCLYGNGFVISGDKTYKSYQQFDYDGRIGTQDTEIYAFDKARNTIRCPYTFHIEQDRLQPVGKCTYTAKYSVDGADDSYIEIKMNRSTFYDPLGSPDNYASGLNLDGSYINIGYDVYEVKEWDDQTPYRYHFYFYKNEGDDNNIPSFGSEFWYRSSWQYTDGNYYNRTQWAYFLPWNIKLNQGNKNNGKNDTFTTYPDGTIIIRKPLVCSKERRTPHPLLQLVDKAGNRTEYDCDPETPQDAFTLPACCDQAEGDQWECTEWKDDKCSKYCADKNGPGTTKEIRTCKGISKFKQDKTSEAAKCTKKQKRKEGKKCNEMECCSDDAIVKDCKDLTYSFGIDNPCSFKQRLCTNYSKYTLSLPKHEQMNCSRPYYEAIMRDETKCKSEIKKANENGEEEILSDLMLEYYDTRNQELYYTNPETGVVTKYEPVIENGQFVPFEYKCRDDYGISHRYCDKESAMKFLKEEIKQQLEASGEDFDPCTQLKEDIFQTDDDGNIVSYVKLYNYVASPISCQLYIDSNPDQEWVEFKSIDPQNCEIESNIQPTVENCIEEWANKTTVRAYINRDGDFGIGGKEYGCNINVSWKSSKYDFNTAEARPYKKQNYVAVRCIHKKSAVVEYCMESCDSGVCIYRS